MFDVRWTDTELGIIKALSKKKKMHLEVLER